MTPRLVGGIAVATLTVGILTGAAGAIVARDARSPAGNLATVMADHMGGANMGSMMGGPMMGGPMMGGSMMGAGPSFSPQDHLSHHATPTPEPKR